MDATGALIIAKDSSGKLVRPVKYSYGAQRGASSFGWADCDFECDKETQLRQYSPGWAKNVYDCVRLLSLKLESNWFPMFYSYTITFKPSEVLSGTFYFMDDTGDEYSCYVSFNNN